MSLTDAGTENHLNTDQVEAKINTSEDNQDKVIKIKFDASKNFEKSKCICSF